VNCKNKFALLAEYRYRLPDVTVKYRHTEFRDERTIEKAVG
jgi:hypothetical protein